MKYDSYARFLKSQIYKDCIEDEMRGNFIDKTIFSTFKEPKDPCSGLDIDYGLYEIKTDINEKNREHIIKPGNKSIRVKDFYENNNFFSVIF